MKSTRQLGEFRAKSDSGRIYSVIEYQEYFSILESTGVITETEGTKKWKTSDGSNLKQLDAETYRIVSNNEVIRKI